MTFIRRFLPRTPQTLSSLPAYSLWAETYPAEAHNVLMQIEQSAMQSLMPSLEDQVVLDLAGGTGRYGHLAQEQGAKQVITCDNSPAMLAHCVIPQKALATSEAIPLRSASIDIILCGLATGHLSRLQPSMCEISRILKPGGLALISDFHPYQSLSGAKRTFQFKEKTFAVEHHLHHLSDYFVAGEACQLQLTGIKEPAYQGDVPVVIVFRFAKDE